MTYAVQASDLATYLDVLTSPSVMEPLRARLGLAPGTPINVSGEVSPTSPMMTITATGGDPVLLARIASEAGPVLADVATKKFSPLLAANGQSVEATTITPADVPGEPTSPNAKRNLMLGALLGLALGIGLALLRHTLDTKVRTEDDIKALSNRPILGDIPMVKSVKNGLLSLESDPHGRHAESIRRLRTNILFVDVTTAGHSFVVTSSVPGEGKTTTTVNLAIAMADAGSKVLLIDGDLRNPSVASTMGLDGSFGLTTLLLGQADTEDVIQRWRESTLHVLPAGPVPPNPSEPARLGADGGPLRQACRTTTTSSSSTARPWSPSSTPCSSTRRPTASSWSSAPSARRSATSPAPSSRSRPWTPPSPASPSTWCRPARRRPTATATTATTATPT